MRRVTSVVAAWSLVAAAGGLTACGAPRDAATDTARDTATDTAIDSTIGDARTVDADSSLARRHLARADSIDAWAVAHPRGERRFGQVRGGTAPVALAAGPIPDSLDLEAEELVLADERGTPLRVATVPHDPAGDWSGRFTHYFDDAGRTVVFERQVSTSAGGCTDVLRVFERRALAPDGRIVGRVLRLRDKDDRAVADSARCELEGVPDDSVFGTYAALARARSLPR